MGKTSTAGGRATSARREKYTPTGGGAGGPPVPPRTLDELRDAMHDDYANRLATARTFLRSATSADTQRVLEHAMDHFENMRSATIGGIEYRFSDATFDAAAESIVERLVGSNRDLPGELTRHTTQITFSSQSPLSGAAATGGDGHGRIVNYRGKSQANNESHEMAHNLAYARYGNPHPPPDSDFYLASKSGEPPPTEYGKKNVAEDFADSVRMYVMRPGDLARLAPRRYKIIKRLLEDPNYGG